MSSWTVPGYQETGRLGSGATGRVVAAVHRASGTQVAIKYLSPRLCQEPEFLERFRIEARLLAELATPNVVRYYDYIETDTDAALVMELVDGVTLRTVLKESGPLIPEAALLLMRGSLLGLAAAHAVGIVHRDYKPANVLIDADGNSKLADFGISDRRGADMSSTGTPSYMAPEQWDGAPAQPVSDIYATTIVLFECLTGRVPYKAETLYELQELHQTAPIPIAEVPLELQPLVAHGLAKDVGYRPADAAAFVAELELVAGAAFGEEWEERGRRYLIFVIGTLAALLPLALLEGALGSGSTASGTTAIGTGAGNGGVTFAGGGTGAGAGGGAAAAGEGLSLAWLGARAAQAKVGILVAVVAVVAVTVAVVAMGSGAPPSKEVGNSAPGSGLTTSRDGGGGGDTGTPAGSDSPTTDDAAAAPPAFAGTPTVTPSGLPTPTTTFHPASTGPTGATGPTGTTGPTTLTSGGGMVTLPPIGTAPRGSTSSASQPTATTSTATATTTVPTTTTTTVTANYKVSVTLTAANTTYNGVCGQQPAPTFNAVITVKGTLTAPITVALVWHDAAGASRPQSVVFTPPGPKSVSHSEPYASGQSVKDTVSLDWSAPNGTKGPSTNNIVVSIICQYIG